MTILYLTYIDLGDFQSGSSVRPQMMYEAFLLLGREVRFLQAQQGRREQHRHVVEEVNRWFDTNRPDFYYVESPSGPILHTFNRELIRRVHKKGISVGYLYWDAASRSDKVFVPGRKSLEQHVTAWMSERDVRSLEKNTDPVYLPTESTEQYFDFLYVAFLPPACMGSRGNRLGKLPGKRSIYVGGVSRHYSADTLLRAFDLLNGDRAEFPLTLVCRPQGVIYIEERVQNKSWLKLVHASGTKELAPLYEQADLTLYPIEKNAYNDSTFSVKLMEYLEYGLPMVAVNYTETEKFIQKCSPGLVCENDPTDFAEKVPESLRDIELYAHCVKNTVQAVQGNLQTDRAKTILADLSGSQGGEQA